MGGTLLIDGMNFWTAFEGTALDWSSSAAGAAMSSLMSSLPLLLAETSSLSQLLGNVWLGVQVALGLGFVIFVHELGHFLAAKTFGVRCDKFYVGFDVPISIGPIHLPRTLGKFQWGETEYGIGIIPLGGYVKMLGQDDDPRAAEEEAKRIRLGEGEEAPLDPRSYPAKPVWQRMIIISAGVVMNLIFAVILAAAAYWVGVPYPPTVAGSTYAGGPAWEAGIQTGDQVVKLGDMKDEDPHMRYNDLVVAVVMRGFDDKSKPLPMTLLRGDEQVEVTASPSAKYSKDSDIYRIGLMAQNIPKIGSPPYSPNSFLAQSKPDLEPGDVVTAVDGDPLPVDPRFNQVLGSELTQRLQAAFEKPVSITVERTKDKSDTSPQELKIVLPPVPVKTLGLGFVAGPVTGIQAGSIAAKSDLRVGDVIEAVNGQPVDNALELPARIGELAGQEIKLTVRRAKTGVPGDALKGDSVLGNAGEAPPGPKSAGADSDEAQSTERASSVAAADFETVEVTLPGPERASFDPISDIAGELTLGGLGVALAVTNTISSVDPSHWKPEDAIRVGDELLQIQWLATPEQKKELAKQFRPKAFEAFVIDNQFTTSTLYDLQQSLPAGSELKCWLRRDGKTIDAVAKLEYAKDWYWHQRGIALSPMMSTHQTDSVATALKLGMWETSRRFHDVLDFLRLLVTGKIGAKGVGGPIAIAEAAGSEASYGVARLMIFLTLLSANLAILNFLPIPALDGGHMVFLIAEAIRGKPVNEALQVRLTMLGVLGLLSLMAFVIVKDIMRLMT
ncbi:MAG: site-2 protease family protein [Planctomycetales bacterium]|nr:site-2 protease family protein [Planctomycetales bacterium]